VSNESEESDRGLMEVSQHLTAGIKENNNMRGQNRPYQAEIRTEHLLNTSLDNYRQTSLLGKMFRRFLP
jgi:hypothetical protein